MRCGTSESDALGRSSGPVELARENRRGLADNELNHGRPQQRDGGLSGDFSVNFCVLQKYFLARHSSPFVTRCKRVGLPRGVGVLGHGTARRNVNVRMLPHATASADYTRRSTKASVFIDDLYHRGIALRACGASLAVWMHEKIRRITNSRRQNRRFSSIVSSRVSRAPLARRAARDTCNSSPYPLRLMVTELRFRESKEIPNDKSRPSRGSSSEDRCLVGASRCSHLGVR